MRNVDSIDEQQRPRVSTTVLLRRLAVVVPTSLIIGSVLLRAAGLPTWSIACGDALAVLLLPVAFLKRKVLPPTGLNPRRLVARFAVIPALAGILASIAAELNVVRSIGFWAFLVSFLVLLAAFNAIYLLWFDKEVAG